MTDEYTIDKAQVKRAFSRAANAYDASAILQAEVRQQMLDRLALVKLTPSAILDAGCGTGHASSLLMKKYPEAQIISLDLALGMLQRTKQKAGMVGKLMQMIGLRQQHYVAGDLEQLPLAGECVQLLWSNLALQWCNDLDAAFGEAHRVLSVGGLFSFTTFGPDTLKELRIATQADPKHIHVSRFIDMHDIGDALVRAGFSAPVLDVERYTLTYDDVISLMHDLKAIGAHNASHGRQRGLSGKGFLQGLQKNYEQFRHGGKLPATYEVVFGHAWKSQSRKPLDASLEAGFAPIQFRKRQP